MAISLPSISLSSQDLLSCNEPYIIDLSIGYSVGGFGLNGCGCSEEVDDCELIHIIMRRLVDGEIELLECEDISLTERWWREEEDYIDIYDPLTCEEYPESETHSDRYEFNTSHLGLGDTLKILICKNDPYNDNLIELRAYPGESCMESNCPPQLDCPATFKLRKNLDCVYELPDFTSGIILTDTCQSPDMDVSEEYFIIQNPPAGTLIEDSTFVEITIQDQERTTVGSCDIFVTLAGDPPPEMDDPSPIQAIIHGDILPDFQLLLAHDTMYDNSIIQVQVETTIDDFTPSPCEGYEVTYRWSATDACANTVSKKQTFEVLPDVNDPIFASVPINIDTILYGQPLPILVDLVAVNADGSMDGIVMTKSIDPYEENLCEGYPVTYRWSATDECNNSVELDKTFYVKAVNAPPIFLEAIIPIDDISYGDPMPTPQIIHAMGANGDTTNVYVTHSVEPYIEYQCDPFEVQYVWTAQDSCNNMAAIKTSFMVQPQDIDFTDMFDMDDISLAITANCEQEAILVMPDILEEYENIGVTFSVHDDQWRIIEEFNGEDESSYVFELGTTYVIYSVTHQCGASFQDTVTITAEDILAPVLECLEDITLYINDLNTCTALAEWSIPIAQDNCGSTTVAQLEGPQLGSSIASASYKITYEATDDNGNKDTCSFQLNVLPFRAEDFTCTPFEVEIDEVCEAWIDVNALIQENSISCISGLEASIIINSDTLSGPNINLQPYKGQEINYIICDKASGLCCGSSLQLKDRTKPIIVCDNDIYVSCIISAEEYRPQVAGECGNISWQYTEQGTVEKCENDSVRATVIRTFFAIDEEGNRSDPCIQQIHILYAQLDHALTISKIVFPPDTTINCDNYDFVNTGFTLLGTPTIGSLPIEINKGNICGISASYVDDIIVNSGCTKFVHRRWTLSEPQCQFGVNIQTYTQVIKIIDTTAPELRLSKKYYTLGGDSQTCTVEFPIPEIYGSDNCDSELEFTIIHNGFWYDTNIPSLTLSSGINKILIRAEDDCNNYDFDTITVHVRDPIIPVAVCFENTNVAISSSSVVIYASDLDAGSHDNCELQKVEIKRSRTTCTIEDSYFKNHVTFCCEDIGNAVEILLKATDQSGNTNICTAIINVVDKTPPTLSIPPNLVVDCKLGITRKGDNDPYGHLFGTPSIHNNHALTIPSLYVISASGALLSGEATDNCPNDIVINVETVSNTNDCGVGTILRKFTAIDGYGNKSTSKEQIVEVRGGFTLDTNLIVWPKLDTTIIECSSIRDINPDILGRPYIREEACALYGVSHEDTYYNLIGDTNGACSKMSRKWTVINWCDTNTNLYASKTQIIKLVDDEAPQLETCIGELEVYGEGVDCNFITVNIKKKASDNCTSNNHLIWSLIIDENSADQQRIENITIDSNGWANAEIILSIGSHDITWVVSDQCGNESLCVQTILVDNNKAPTPFATGLTTSISSNLEVEIKASDLLAKAEHPCYDKLEISISRADESFVASSNSILFDCSDIGTNYINVYASRILSNGTVTYDYTTVKIEIQDNFEFCQNSNSNESENNGVVGSVSTAYGVVLQDATVSLKDMYSSKMEETKSDNTGSYIFSSIQEGRPYALNASYDDSMNNGLTTRDVILIQQHLMGINSYESHWQMIQSDVNQDQRVSSIDIVELRKTIIGLSSEMDLFPAWRFLDAHLLFNPLNYSDQVAIKDGVYIDKKTNEHEDLIGIKLGDVDHTAILTQDHSKSRTLEKHNLRITDRILNVDQESEIMIYLDDAIGLGWQLELLIDDNIQILEVINPHENKGVTRKEKNKISSSISQPTAWNINCDSPILILKVKALQEISIKEGVRLSTSSVKPEFYGGDLNFYKLEIEYLEEISQISVSPASPNPFNSFSSISISMPNDQKANMVIADVTGKIFLEKSMDLKAGGNPIELSSNNFTFQGIYILHLTIGDRLFTQRLIFAH